MERVTGPGEFPRVDEFAADALDVPAGLAHHQAGLPPAPAALLQVHQIGAEDVVETPGQELLLLIPVDDAEAGSQPHPPGILPQQGPAQGVDGGDADPGEVARVAGGGGHRRETLPELPGRRPVVGAKHQLLGTRYVQQEDVGAPERHHQGLARSRTGDAQDGSVQVGNDVQLARVQTRVDAQDGGGDIGDDVFHGDGFLVRLMAAMGLNWSARR